VKRLSKERIINKDDRKVGNMNHTISFIKIEFIKSKKNNAFLIYFLAFIILSIILTFILHLGRFGNSGNLEIPLNYSYGGYAFNIVFYICIFIILLLLDSDIRDEIKSNKIFLILTQSASRTNYFLGKTLHWFIVCLFWLLVSLVICHLISYNLIFSGRPPRFDNGAPVSDSFLLSNLIFSYISLLPSIYFFILLAFISGFFFYSSAAGLLFISGLVILSYEMKGFFFFPLLKIYFPSAIISLPKIADPEVIFKFFLFSLMDIMIIFFCKIVLNKREFR